MATTSENTIFQAKADVELTPKQLERFWRDIQKTESCWLWTGNKLQAKNGRLGYGRFHLGQRVYIKAHRLSWIIANGPIPVGKIICHTCDNPVCVNPAHLFVGTFADNRHDQDSKLRHNHGERVNTNKLTEAQVLEIRAIWDAAENKQGLIASLSRQFDISDSQITFIVRRESWKHLP